VQLLARTATKLAAIALANKTARIVWALMTSGESYRDPGPVSFGCRAIAASRRQADEGWEGQTGANAQSRLVRDYEQRLDVSEAMIFLAMGNLLLRRITHP
jgi:hypothetical protein